jgi:uncharacterized protein YegP (UPF0339 family)
MSAKNTRQSPTSAAFVAIFIFVKKNKIENVGEVMRVALDSRPELQDKTWFAYITSKQNNNSKIMAQLDNYLPCEQYTAAPASEKYPGFNAWAEPDGGWFFAVVTNRGRVVLRSESYTSEAGRDNGIESVMRNRDIEERYSVAEEDGKWYVILKAGNKQEIARSCAYDSEADAQAGIAACFSTFTERAASSSAQEDYMECAYYAKRAASEKYPGFTAWTDETTGQHYFALVNKKGDVLLRSEGYDKAASRDNGIESVMRNRDLEERYGVVQDEHDGQWYTSLKAGNHQEIARSCGYDSQAAATALIAACSSTAAEKDARAWGTSDDYLACEAYQGHPKADKYPGFHPFTDAATGLHYFALTDGHDDVILRSEAYSKESARDNGIESVMRNRDIEERYSVVQDEHDGQWYVSLKAGNHQEIARSCGFADKAGADNHLLHCFTKGALERMATGADQIIEDYLPCTAYANKPAAPEFEGFTIFQDEKTGLHYFAMIDDDGNVALKSEGYKDPKRRDNGIESVVRNRGIKDHWREMEDEHGPYMSLRAVNHQEIARSCHYKDKSAMLAWFAPFVAAHAAWSSDAEPEEKVAAAVAPPAPKVVPTAKPAVAAPPPPVTSYTNAADDVAAAAGGNDWWKWLLGLALLGLLAWLLMRGCDNKKTDVTATPPPVTAPTPPPPAATPAPAPAPAPAAATCNCSGNADDLFNLSSSATPKPLSRLGTNPEFGDSHGLSPAEFLAKLQSRAKANAADQRFLDRVYKGMGYKGFADAKADQYSAVELPAGTSGNLGYSKTHKTGYYTLPDNARDRQAFRIKSANGCDFHFMKTCGNHFFFCSK